MNVTAILLSAGVMVVLGVLFGFLYLLARPLLSLYLPLPIKNLR